MRLCMSVSLPNIKMFDKRKHLLDCKLPITAWFYWLELVKQKRPANTSIMP